MLQTDPIVSKYPKYLPLESEVNGAFALLDKPEHRALKVVLEETICIAGCARSQMRRFCWQAREEGLHGEKCSEGAVDWLKRCAEARTRLRMDTLLQSSGPFTPAFRELYLRAMPFSVHGTDKQGHPVTIARYGSVDLELFRQLWEMGAEMQEQHKLAVNGVVLFHLRTMEYITRIVCANETKRQGRVVDRILCIMDVGGVGLKHLKSPLKTFLGAVSKECISLYPETMHATVLANVPWVVSRAAWPIIKNFLHPVTQDKFTMLNSPAQLREKMFELIDADQIPPDFGGKCSCEECLSGVPRGGSLQTWEEEQGLFGLKVHPSVEQESPPFGRWTSEDSELGDLGNGCCPMRAVPTPLQCASQRKRRRRRPPPPPLRSPSMSPQTPDSRQDERPPVLLTTPTLRTQAADPPRKEQLPPKLSFQKRSTTSLPRALLLFVAVVTMYYIIVRGSSGGRAELPGAAALGKRQGAPINFEKQHHRARR